MPPDNTGSFGAAIGGSDPIKAAMARRGMGAGVTQQVSPAAATFEPGAIPPQSAGTQTAPAMPAGPQPLSGNSGGTPGLPPGGFESQVIVKALNDRLKSLSKIEEAKNIPQGGF